MSIDIAYILYGYKFSDKKRADVNAFIKYVSLSEEKTYFEGCKVILEELVATHGKPEKIRTDDEFSDEKRFINQQIVNAYMIFKNTDKCEQGTNIGKPKHSWYDKFRRIEGIYEKLRPESKFHDQNGNYYFVVKKKIQ